jgi:Flp pilus assembly protein TadB
VKRERRPVLITNAEPSQHDQLRSREIRYVLMMSFRAVCLVAAAVLVSVHAPLLWLWIPICLVGMIVVPWFAVLLANDRPPKEKHRLANKLHHQPGPAEEPAPLALPATDPVRVIDAEE